MGFVVTDEALTVWAREQYVDFVGEDDGVGIPHLNATTVEAAMAVRVKEYGPDANEDLTDEELTATHCIRFVLQWPDLTPVDGDCWWIKVTDEGVELLTFPDAPAIQGTDLESAVEWCDQFN
ncbi:hypothetical protein D3C81_961450 [compost metagenome]